MGNSNNSGAPSISKKHCTSLIEAVAAQNSAEVHRLLEEGKGVNDVDEVTKFSPLLAAINVGSVLIVGLLLKYGADANLVPGWKGMSPLCLACKLEVLEQAETVALLLEHGADVEQLIGAGEWALMVACKCDSQQVATVHALTAHGANVNRQSPTDGTTALHEACRRHHAPVVDVLIRSGADVNVQDMHGHSPVFLATSHAVLNRLLESGADVNITDKNGLSVLHNVCRSGGVSDSLLTQIISCGADINATANNGFTPLHYACQEPKKLAAARFLVRNGADVNIHNNQGLTPLHMVDFKTRQLLERLAGEQYIGLK